MGNYLNVGNAGFHSIRKSRYVDKSQLISFVNGTLGTMEKLTCVSRPRRFGKSYAAKMLCAYYDKSCNSEKLFDDLKIAQDKSYREHLNRYDVLYLDMTWFISIASDIKNTVSELQEKVIRELQEFYPDARKEKTLPEMLAEIYETTGNKFIIIIDEWDALFREAKNEGALQRQYIQLLRGLFKSGSQTDKMIEAAYMTGILPIKKYGTQSALTDFREYTMLQPEPLDSYMGFTEEEVCDLCKESKLDFQDIQGWYDGYTLGNHIHIYSPKSVIDAVVRNRLDNYWTQSETYESLKIYIDLDEDGLKESIVQMLGGTRVKIDTGTFQNDITTIKTKDDVLTLLIHLGYLAYDADTKSVFIPNEEVKQEFIRAVVSGKHKEVSRLIRNSDQLLEQTLCMEEEAVAAAIEKAHEEGTAPAFYNNEQALRSVIKFAYISCIDNFLRIEELTSGKGYADVVFFPKKISAMPVLLIELKWNKTAEGAIKQIKEKNYPQALQNYGGDILLVGINYDAKTGKHTCRIEKYEKS
ncbi:MAG: ATP-binding protein [Lachnospiraceae bacterium]|nr:ATP-binding protein [Lachnospiraceae bacterium]